MKNNFSHLAAKKKKKNIGEILFSSNLGHKESHRFPKSRKQFWMEFFNIPFTLEWSTLLFIKYKVHRNEESREKLEKKLRQLRDISRTKLENSIHHSV